MKPQNISRKRVLEALENNGTNAKAIAKVKRKLKKGKHIKLGVDKEKKFVVIQCDGRVGVAKRATHAKLADEFNLDRAIAIAVSRL